MDLLTWTTLIALSVKIVSVVKMVFPKLNPWQIQLAAWLVSIAAVFLGAQVQGVQDTKLGDIALVNMLFWTKVYVGLGLGAVGSLTNDTLRAVDNNSTTKV